MSPETTALILVALIMAPGAFVQSVSGFGMALVAVALLPLVMDDLKDAIALIAVFNLFVSTLTLFWNRSSFSWKAARPLVLGMMIGIPLGFYFLHSTDSTILIRILGCVLILIAISDIIMSRKSHYSLPTWSAWPFAIFGGVIGGAFNVGGPPIVAYTYSQNWSKTQVVAVLQSVFLIAGFFRNSLIGDLFFTGLFVALYVILPQTRRHLPAGAGAPAQPRHRPREAKPQGRHRPSRRSTGSAGSRSRGWQRSSRRAPGSETA